MSLVLTQEGGQRLWRYMLGIVSPPAPLLHLLGLPYNPQHSSTLSLFAANEVTGDTGYMPLPLSSPAAWWTISGIAAGAEAQYITVSWTLVSQLFVYGYFLSDSVFGVSLWGELFSSPWSNPGPPGVIALQLPITLTSLPASS